MALQVAVCSRPNTHCQVLCVERPITTKRGPSESASPSDIRVICRSTSLTEAIQAYIPPCAQQLMSSSIPIYSTPSTNQTWAKLMEHHNSANSLASIHVSHRCLGLEARDAIIGNTHHSSCRAGRVDNCGFVIELRLPLLWRRPNLVRNNIIKFSSVDEQCFVAGFFPTRAD